MSWDVDCNSAEVTPSSRSSFTIRLDTSIKDIVDAVGADELLEQIGRDAAVKYWDIEEVGEEG